jgi:manganese efflux pump family protein
VLTGLLVLGVVVGSNNLAAAMALGALGQAHRVWRVIAVFGMFEFCVPLLGLILGRQLSETLEAYAGWLGPLLLVGLGAWALRAASKHGRSDHVLAQRASTWGGLVLLASALSIDNLVVGFSLGLRRLEPLLVATTIAAFSMAFTWLGIRLGSAARRHWERYAEFGAGLLLVGLGIASWLGWF